MVSHELPHYSTHALRLLISVERGRERRVARDLMDALLPHDKGIRLELVEGGVLVYSSLSSDQLLNLLQRYPIRGLLRARKVIALASGDLPGAVERLLLQVAGSGLKLRAAEVRTHGLVDRREVEQLVLSAGSRLGLFNRNGLRVRIQLLRDKCGEWLLVLAA